VLASTSPWRRRMLESAGVRIRAVGSGVDERALEQAILAREPGPDAPRRIAAALAGAKARAVAALHPGSWVLAADQVGQDPAGPERPIGKSSGAADHLLQLRALVGRRHDLLTAWVLLGPAGERAEGVCTSSLWMRGDLTDDELAAYVATGEGERVRRRLRDRGGSAASCSSASRATGTTCSVCRCSRCRAPCGPSPGGGSGGAGDRRGPRADLGRARGARGLGRTGPPRGASGRAARRRAARTRCIAAGRIAADRIAAGRRPGACRPGARRCRPGVDGAGPHRPRRGPAACDRAPARARGARRLPPLRPVQGASPDRVRGRRSRGGPGDRGGKPPGTRRTSTASRSSVPPGRCSTGCSRTSSGCPAPACTS
jgi:predicted house-cleaning NTP pyrophosphatase (Maf/HAM1 superfamily)